MQGGPLPQPHPPFEQLSDLKLQPSQLAPPLPQAAVVFPARQVDPEQQPEQELGSQTQLPPVHFCPAPQLAELPQRHEPLAQLSAVEGSHAVQAAPDTPQCEEVPATQVVPEQQPFTQEDASQMHAPA